MIFEKQHFARDSNKLMLDKLGRIGKAQPLSNAGLTRLLVITAVAINPVPTTVEIVAKRFIF